jgi:hypothetical protein
VTSAFFSVCVGANVCCWQAADNNLFYVYISQIIYVLVVSISTHRSVPSVCKCWRAVSIEKIISVNEHLTTKLIEFSLIYHHF